MHNNTISGKGTRGLDEKVPAITVKKTKKQEAILLRKCLLGLFSRLIFPLQRAFFNDVVKTRKEKANKHGERAKTTPP